MKKITLITLLVFVLSAFAVVPAFAYTPDTELESTVDLEGYTIDQCYRQYFAAWSENQTVTVYSGVHEKPNGKYAVSCGAIVKTTKYVWRTYLNPGTMCWDDVCIHNHLVNINNKLRWVTDVSTLNGYKLVRVAIWNVIKPNGNPQ